VSSFKRRRVTEYTRVFASCFAFTCFVNYPQFDAAGLVLSIYQQAKQARTNDVTLGFAFNSFRLNPVLLRIVQIFSKHRTNDVTSRCDASREAINVGLAWSIHFRIAHTPDSRLFPRITTPKESQAQQIHATIDQGVTKL
jgi:hypothetical protein